MEVRTTERIETATVGLVVLVSRLPFLSRSYGVDGDAWNVARTARDLGETGVYAFSRPPGYPVQELVCAVVHGLGPLATNGLTVLLSAMGAMLFHALLRRLLVARPDAILGAIALAFVPVVYVNSTVTLDYIWALTGILAAFHALLCGRAVLAGIALGLAIGCRITSGAILLPLLVLWGAGDLRPRVRMTLVVLSVGALAYVPPWIAHGPTFLRFIDEPISMETRVRLCTYGLTIGTWGVLGSLGVVAALPGLFFRTGRGVAADRLPRRQRRSMGVACLLAVALYAIAFLRLPLEFAYLLPAVPFVLLSVLLFTPLGLARFAMITCLISPFLVDIDLQGNRHLAGPVCRDAATKRDQLRSIRAVHDAVNALETKRVVLVTGPDIDRFRALPRDLPGFVFEHEVEVVRWLSSSERSHRLRAGSTVVHLFKDGPDYTRALVFTPAPNGPPSIRELTIASGLDPPSGRGQTPTR